MKGFFKNIIGVSAAIFVAAVFIMVPLAGAFAQEAVTCPDGHICIAAGEAWLAAVPIVSFAASLLANALPSPVETENAFMRYVSRFVNLLAGNIRVKTKR